MTDIYKSKIKQLDGTLLLVFQELLRSHNATKTAQKLNMSQSAVSSALSRLRHLFDDPLFVRRAHGLDPTSRALELAVHLDRILETATQAFGLSETFDPVTSERLFRIAAPEFITAVAGQALSRTFAKAGPQLSVSFRYMAMEPALERLARGTIDLAIGRRSTIVGPEVHSIHLYTDEFCVVARRRHPEVKGNITKSQYHRLHHVFATADTELDPNEKDPGFKPEAHTVLVPQWLTALTMVATSDALATCPRSLAEAHAQLFNLQVLRPPFKPNRFDVCAFANAGRKDAGISWLISNLRRSITH